MSSGGTDEPVARAKSMGGEVEVYPTEVRVRSTAGPWRVVPLVDITHVVFKEPTKVIGGSLRVHVLSRDFVADAVISSPSAISFGRRQAEQFQHVRDVIEAAMVSRSVDELPPPPVPVVERPSGRPLTTFETVELFEDFVWSPRGAGPLSGAHASIDTAGQVTRRSLVDRYLYLGAFAGLGKSEVDRRELYLVVEGDGYGIVVPINPNLGDAARQFASLINAKAGTADRPPPPDLPPPPTAPTDLPAPPANGDDLVTRLERLRQLHESGALSDDDYDRAKSAVLDGA